MITLKYIAAGIVLLIATVLIYAFFKSKSTLVETAVVIDKPVHEVYTFFSHLKNQDLYNKIRLQDQEMIKDLKGTDGTVGFIYSWSSNVTEVGVGEQEITRLVPYSRIETQIRFKKPFASNDPFTIITEQIDSTHTKTHFSYLLSMSYPTNIMIPVFSGKVKETMHENLSNAKIILERESNFLSH